MKTLRLNQSGALHLSGIIVIVLVITVVGFVGARVINNSKASSLVGNGLAIVNSHGDTWSKQTGLVDKFFWPDSTKCERKDGQVSVMYSGVFGNNGKQVNYVLGKIVNNEPRLFLCRAPIDKPQTAQLLTPIANKLMTTREESGYEYLKNPIITSSNKIAFEIRLMGETKSTYKFYNPDNNNLLTLSNFGQSMGYQWEAASDTKIITYRTNYPYNKCVYNIATDKSDCNQTLLPKETVQVFVPRSNEYMVYLTKTTVNGKQVGVLYKSDLNGSNKKVLRKDIEVPKILALSPSETKILFNENYKLKLLTIASGEVEGLSAAQEFAIWQPIPPTTDPN